MPSDPEVRYITPHGGPPSGGRPPGMPCRMPARAPTLSIFPEPPPPPYSSSPPPLLAHTSLPAAIPFTGFYPWSHFVPWPAALIPIATGAHHQSPVSPPPPARPEDPPGAKLDGAKIEFDDGISTYIFPEHHTIIHLVAHGHQPWEYPGERLTFTVHKVPCSMPIKELIRRLGCPGVYDHERGVVECHEVGGGVWLKGSTFRLHEDQSKQRIEEVGWTPSRGTTRKPIWLAVYKA
ncbi:hypothetical protein MMC13_003718 [Lambiella insularis]|nr:hypothetical protein [Lambiella insularis]